MPAVLTDIKEIAQRFSCLCQTEARTHFYSPAPSPVEPFSFCQMCRHPRCTPQNTYEYGIREAFRWQGRYIYYCPAGLTFVAACTAHQDSLAAGVTMGPTKSRQSSGGYKKEIASGFMASIWASK